MTPVLAQFLINRVQCNIVMSHNLQMYGVSDKRTRFFFSEATVYSGVHWMHGWHDLCLHGASQLFSVGDILNSSGVSFFFSCLYSSSISFSPLLEQTCNQGHDLMTSNDLMTSTTVSSHLMNLGAKWFPYSSPIILGNNSMFTGYSSWLMFLSWCTQAASCLRSDHPLVFVPGSRPCLLHYILLPWRL